jgi:hypothetical protein
MKIKAKEKTVRTYTIKLTENELRGLYSNVYDLAGVYDFTDYPHLYDLLDSLRAEVHRL